MRDKYDEVVGLLWRTLRFEAAMAESLARVFDDEGGIDVLALRDVGPEFVPELAGLAGQTIGCIDMVDRMLDRSTCDEGFDRRLLELGASSERVAMSGVTEVREDPVQPEEIDPWEHTVRLAVASDELLICQLGLERALRQRLRLQPSAWMAALHARHVSGLVQARTLYRRLLALLNTQTVDGSLHDQILDTSHELSSSILSGSAAPSSLAGRVQVLSIYDELSQWLAAGGTDDVGLELVARLSFCSNLSREIDRRPEVAAFDLVNLTTLIDAEEEDDEEVEFAVRMLQGRDERLDSILARGTDVLPSLRSRATELVSSVMAPDLDTALANVTAQAIRDGAVLEPLAERPTTSFAEGEPVEDGMSIERVLDDLIEGVAATCAAAAFDIDSAETIGCSSCDVTMRDLISKVGADCATLVRSSIGATRSETEVREVVAMSGQHSYFFACVGDESPVGLLAVFASDANLGLALSEARRLVQLVHTE